MARPGGKLRPTAKYAGRRSFAARALDLLQRLTDRLIDFGIDGLVTTVMAALVLFHLTKWASRRLRDSLLPGSAATQHQLFPLLQTEGLSPETASLASGPAVSRSACNPRPPGRPTDPDQPAHDNDLRTAQTGTCRGIALAEIARDSAAQLPCDADPTMRLYSGANLDAAQPGHIAYFDDARHLEALRITRAGACLVAERFAHLVPQGTIPIIVQQPRLAYARILARMHPEAVRAPSLLGSADVISGCFVHPTARIGAGVVLDPGTVIGEGVVIGNATIIGAHAVLGPDVVIGADCWIGANVTIAHCSVGDRAVVKAGACLGQDGFGFATSRSGHFKLVHLGRVVLGNDVEIGANSTVDRGSGRDTLIGDGTKIDNLVQIAHNVRIGRRCILAAQVGIAGSTTVEDDVGIGGQSAIAGHLLLGRGAQLAAASRLMRDIPAGERWGGMPAKPLREWFREVTTIKNLAKRRSGNSP